MSKGNLYFINPIYMKLAKIATEHCVIARKTSQVKIPIVKLSNGMLCLFLAAGNNQREISLNQRLYDMLTNRGINPDLVGGYFVIDGLNILMQVIDQSQDLSLRFESSTAHDLSL